MISGRSLGKHKARKERMESEMVDIDIDSMTVDELVIKKLKRALIKARGNVTDAARMCGMSRSTAREWINQSSLLQNTLNKVRDMRHNGEI
jgi:DNA-binding protein Fis